MVAGTGRIRSICRICFQEYNYSIVNTVRDIHTCCGQPLLIAGRNKTDVHGASGQTGAVVDPIVRYRTQERAPSPESAAPAMPPRPYRRHREPPLEAKEKRLAALFEERYGIEASPTMIKTIYYFKLFKTVTLEQLIRDVFSSPIWKGEASEQALKTLVTRICKRFGNYIEIETSTRTVYTLKRIGPREAPLFERK